MLALRAKLSKTVPYVVVCRSDDMDPFRHESGGVMRPFHPPDLRGERVSGLPHQPGQTALDNRIPGDCAAPLYHDYWDLAHNRGGVYAAGWLVPYV